VHAAPALRHPEARAMATRISEYMRDQAYLASVELAKERGAFPLFNADLYLSGGNFASRLPAEVKDKIRKHGLRNSHLLSIAPTGTISLAFADNASNGIEPPFSWTYTRKKRMADGTFKEHAVEDYAWRLYKHLGGDVEKLPEYFVTALEISAKAHKDMVAAVAPYVDTSISKTVNVPADYPYAEFEDLYLDAWKSGLKGLATYRPNSVLGSVLSVTPSSEAEAAAGLGDVRRRQPPPVHQEPAGAGAVQPALARPPGPAGRQRRPGPTCSNTPQGKFALFVGHIDPGRQPRKGPSRSRCGSMVPTSRAAWAPWPRPCPWTCAPTTAAGWQAEARIPGQDRRRRSLRHALPAARRTEAHAGRGAAFAQVVRYRVREARRLDGDLPDPGARQRVQPAGAEDRHRRHPVLDGGHPEPGHRRRLRARPEGNHPARTASPAPTRCGCRATTRAPSTA
jgi:ribonucleoside-diphosphate reductase alpha chain